MTTMNQVLPTFPSHADIQDIVKALRSGKYYVVVTRMDGPSLATISRIQQKCYSISSQDDFVREIFPFEEGLTLAGLLDIKKEIANKQWNIN